MEPKIQVNQKELALVKKILNEFLPTNAKIWVFGSRATGQAKKFSDLDLCIDNQGALLESSIKADLAEAFSESDLPYRVDIIDWNGISESFRNKIESHSVLLL